MSAEAQQTLDFSWLHDDTEEDLVGADWHQDAIRALSISLQTLAQERRWPWHVGDQLTLIGDKPGAKDWQPAPDISIHPTLGPDKRQNLDVREVGPPSLVLEVASRSTWKYDVSMESTQRGKTRVGKAFGYLILLRIPEYLVFDPRAEYLAGQVRAWRRAGAVIQDWPPEADGRYYSRALNISFRPDGPFLRVIDPAGMPVPYWFETTRDWLDTTRENAVLRHATREQEQRIAALEAELARLRQRHEPENC